MTSGNHGQSVVHIKISKLLTGVLLLFLEELGDLLANLVVGKGNIVLGVTVVGHEGEETIVGDVELGNLLVDPIEETTGARLSKEGFFLCGAGQGFTHKLVLSAADVGDVHVVSRGREILVLLASENVGSDKMDLGVTVLSSLGGGHVDDLARAVLDDDETVLTQSRALHRVGERRAGIGGVEGHLMLQQARKNQQNYSFLVKQYNRVVVVLIEAQNEDKNHDAALYRGAQIAMRGENPQAKNGRRADFVGACA
ncbi:unnamed protein product [Fusarium graminearum]|nr:hypothetical protein HG531_009760 [Fusarium graminearum]CAF3632961.1 unnamed protein product [Fusarium graminearum]CAG1975713.1 unnamed protein product [Fusarium graminearum]VTO87508.1 unnamed protein product [Fusarium graminearum]